MKKILIVLLLLTSSAFGMTKSEIITEINEYSTPTDTLKFLGIDKNMELYSIDVKVFYMPDVATAVTVQFYVDGDEASYKGMKYFNTKTQIEKDMKTFIESKQSTANFTLLQFMFDLNTNTAKCKVMDKTLTILVEKWYFVELDTTNQSGYNFGVFTQ